MQLLTKELQQQVPALYSQEKEKDLLVICKFFDPVSVWTWYVIEGSPVDRNGERCAEREAVDFCFSGMSWGMKRSLATLPSRNWRLQSRE